MPDAKHKRWISIEMKQVCKMSGYHFKSQLNSPPRRQLTLEKNSLFSVKSWLFIFFLAELFQISYFKCLKYFWSICLTWLFREHRLKFCTQLKSDRGPNCGNYNLSVHLLTSLLHVFLFQWHILTKSIVYLMAVKYLCLHALAHFHHTEWRRTPVPAAQCCPTALANPVNMRR